MGQVLVPARGGRRWLWSNPRPSCAVYEDFLDADGEFERFREGGAVEYRFGIEEGEVGEGAFADDAAVFPADALSGERRHFADGFGQRKPMFFADVDAEDAGEGAGSARMFGADAAVAGDHDPGLLIERFDVGLDHRFADDARLRCWRRRLRE